MADCRRDEETKKYRGGEAKRVYPSRVTFLIRGIEKLVVYFYLFSCFFSFFFPLFYFLFPFQLKPCETSIQTELKPTFLWKMAVHSCGYEYCAVSLAIFPHQLMGKKLFSEKKKFTCDQQETKKT